MKPPPEKRGQRQRIILPGQLVVPPTLSDFTSMSWPQLVLEARATYQRLQLTWAAELKKPRPNWQVLEKAAEQMHLLESGCGSSRSHEEEQISG